jgi:aminoglycoside phosphotransferase (APT) family kinase protein
MNDPRDAIGRLLDERFELAGARAHVLQSSCPLLEIELRDAAGCSARMLLKDVGARAPAAGPAFLYRPDRELAMYRALAEWGLASPRLLGAQLDRDSGRCRLLLERVEGFPLWQSGDEDDWCAAASWLAQLHQMPARTLAQPWLRYDEEYYARWMRRARMFHPYAGLDVLETAHALATSRLAKASRVIVHGDFHPSNVLVRGGGGVCPLDFELGGVGAAALDLAALTTGLPQDFAGAVVNAYRLELEDPQGIDELDELLACARLHLAVRWLGWSAHPRPPDHERYDWLAEAHAAAAAVDARLAAGVGK